MARSAPDLDEALALFWNEMYKTNPKRANRQIFVNTVSGVELFLPRLERTMKRSRAVYNGWNKAVAAKSPPPIPLSLAFATFFWFLDSGAKDVALGCLIFFFRMLRISEVCALRWKDIILPGDPCFPPDVKEEAARLLVRDAKTGKLQVVLIKEELVCQLLILREKGQNRKAFVLGLSVQTFREELATCWEALGCTSKGFKSHSFRHGGATHFFMAGEDPQCIQFTGRWISSTSFRRYVQAGRGLLLAAEFPKKTMTRMASAERRLRRLQDR